MKLGIYQNLGATEPIREEDDAKIVKNLNYLTKKKEDSQGNRNLF